MDLLIAGIIQDQRYFDERVRPHLNDSTIQYIGPVDPVQRDKLFGQAYATLHLNTIPERFGLVLAESMAAGVPVIAQDLGSCREVIQDQETGYLVRGVTDAVTALGKIEKIERRRCRRRVEEHFSIARMAERYEQVYEEIFRREATKERREP